MEPDLQIDNGFIITPIAAPFETVRVCRSRRVGGLRGDGLYLGGVQLSRSTTVMNS